MPLSRWAHRIPGLADRGFYETLCRFSFCVVVVTILTQRIFLGRNDPQRCVALLSGGSWPPHDTLASWRPYFHKWEPRGCRMYEYQPADIYDCLSGRRLVFVGDSTVRQIFYATAKRLNKVVADEMLVEVLVSSNPQHDVELEIDGVSLVFIWDPWLNSTGLATELQNFSPGPPSSTPAGSSTTGTSAALLLVGAPGLWAARSGGEDYFELFQRGIDSVRPWLKDGIQVDSSVSGYSDLQNRIVVAPVQVPQYWKLAPARAESLTREKISSMNAYLDALPGQEASHVITAYNEMTRPGTRFAFEDTGIHVREALADRKADILLNLRCNGGLVRQSQDHRNQETCCSAYEPLRRGHYLGILASLIVAVIYIRYSSMQSTPTSKYHAKRRHDRPAAQRFHMPLALLGVILYCYFSDRTQLFPKAAKRLSAGGIAVSLVVGGAVAAASLRRWLPSPVPNRSSDRKRPCSVPPLKSRQRKFPRLEPDDDPGFLSRELTEEWKGWMQGLLLIFSYQDLSDQLWANKISRLPPAAYLFILAYGHTTYFLRTNDYSFKRVASVIWRLNALPFLVSMAMDADGGLYSFPRLATFWFVIAYCTLGFAQRFNLNPAVVLLKICLAAVATISLLRTDSVFALIGWIISHAVPKVTLDVVAVRQRIELDRLVPFFGMAVAVTAHRAAIIKASYTRLHEERAHQLSPLPGVPINDAASKPLRHDATALAAATGPNTLDRMIATLLYPDDLASCVIWPLIVATIVLAGFGLFFVVTLAIPGVFSDMEIYDYWHPYFSCLPVLAYALMRNIHPSLRRVGFPLLAALGRISLETYVLCHHLWLAGDGRSLLRLGLARRAGLGRFQQDRSFAAAGWVAETMVVGVVFIWISWHARQAVAELGRLLVGDAGVAPQTSGIGSSGSKDDLESGCYRYGTSSRAQSDRSGLSDRSKPRITNVTPSTGSTKLRVGVVVLLGWLSLFLY
ncbi:hypothetical protein PpBr36_03356 [Pyricularia pennisetigena]|uniref:hypothetical protein n=1 Tax=Pyricularia pennisetigena TaxID=1578925 RepID=UPI0011545DA4|nr:hypothetical protein PpBr36_03356 [Pyricularia pennisetigena]TLS31587.1 hypothetical protein PpBr36_03356 [Pyricularia pennisetigena]